MSERDYDARYILATERFRRFRSENGRDLTERLVQRWDASPEGKIWAQKFWAQKLKLDGTTARRSSLLYADRYESIMRIVGR